MDEETLKEFLQDYFGCRIKIISYIKHGKYCIAIIKCYIYCQSHVDDFIKLN